MASAKPDLFAHAARGAITSFTEDDKRNWLRLIRSENIGPVTFHQLLAHYGTAEDALAALPELGRRGGLTRPGRICSARDADRELSAAAKAGVRIAAIRRPIILRSSAISTHRRPSC